MADLNVALILRLVDRATGPARAAVDRIDRATRGAFSRNAAQVDRGARLMASGFGDVTRGAAKAGMAVAAYHGIMAGIGAAFVRPAAQMERFEVQLTNLEGSAEGAETAIKWIQDFATRTPLQLEDTISAYARLKAFGLDPTNGSMQALVDTMAATGGSAEQLDGLVLALGQAWTKGKLQGEEALQMLERGVPVWDLLAEKLGRTTAEVQAMASSGKLGREEIMLLVDALAERNDGAAENMSKTWDGIISNLMDHWARWQLLVMDSEVFEYLKSRILVFYDFLNAAAADGRLQQWAEHTAAAIMQALEGIWTLGAAAVGLWQELYPWLEAAAEWTGGWQNLLIAITALAFGKTILGMVLGFGKLAVGLGLVSGGMLGFVKDLNKLSRAQRIVVRFGRALASIFAIGTKSALLGVAAAVGKVLQVFVVLGRAAFFTPLGAAIAGIATAVYAIYDNWSDIVSYFRDKIDRVRVAFDEGLLAGISRVIREFHPTVLFKDAMVGLASWLNEKIRDAFDIDLFEVGAKLIRSLRDGIASQIDRLVEWAKAKLAAINPFADSPEPPFSNQTSAPANSDAAPGSPRAYGGRALGGPVRAGHVYRWLEEGQEMFMPRTDGLVVSNREMRGLRAGATSSSRTMNVGGITINAAPGMNPRDIARAVRAELDRREREARTVLHDGGSYA